MLISRKKCFIFMVFIFLILGMAEISNAATPVINFSDMTDAPTTGWAGSTSKGAAVTIWGRNFGTSGTITVGGQILNSSDSNQVAEWGATTNPIVPLGMQRITFFLNSNMTTGGTYPNTTITVTVGGATSNSLSFHTRILGSNHIYYLDSTKANDNGDGLTVATAKRTTAWARRFLQAGDVVYLKAGTYNDHDSQVYCNGTCSSFHNGGLMSFGPDSGGQNHSDGTQGNGITVTAYPGDNVILDGSTGVDGDIHTLTSAIAVFYSTGNHYAYWTFSKFSIKGLWAAMSMAYGNGIAESSNHIRVIGNDMTTILSASQQWGNILVHYGGSGGGADGFAMYGNYLHDACTNFHGQSTGRRIYNVYIGGYGPLTNIDIGWNEFGYNSQGRGFQIYGHLHTDTLDNLLLHDNWFHDHVRQNAVIGGGDDGPAYTFVRHAWIYNNIFTRPAPDDVALSLQGGAASNGDGDGVIPGYYYVYNNTIEQPANYPVISYGLGVFEFKNNIVLAKPSAWNYFTSIRGTCGATGVTCIADHNLYYGAGAGTAPAWDTSTLKNNNPLLINNASQTSTYSDYALTSNSPAKYAGSSSLSIAIRRDIAGILKNSAPLAPSIGAYEYYSGLASPCAPILH